MSDLEFIAWPKIPRIENEKLTFTEKIDGTNACIVIDHDGNVMTQSRNKIITPEDDNYGFSRWVNDNKQKVIDNLGPGRWFGEWWGLGIQRRYDQTRKRFSLFYYHHEQDKLDRDFIDVVPTLPVASVEQCKEFLRENGSVAAPGWMRPEGAVMYNALTKTRYKVIIDK